MAKERWNDEVYKAARGELGRDWAGTVRGWGEGVREGFWGVRGLVREREGGE